ncbi:Dolichyl-phosphate-mannose-protein mannosyltransferase [Micromonospora auratinigra]|uniref:Dolichyl-phosphate-mannose-protein mannosyltransferase n=1 Tax=Micromonospora auratinigra TaxID=261654 RepID=A0A1A9A9I9_9ACTN|nr:Dolichyl-phosphate-mannose-protein mannosyltransferase [Micromonospora auratinigra]
MAAARPADESGRAAASITRRPFARLPVGLVAAAVAALLAATAPAYGYHRDELYFRVLGRHPAWGYVDQPPGTPLLTRAATAVFGDSVWGLRVPAVLAAVAVAVLLALVAREVGAGALGQTLAACGVAGTVGLLFGHVLITASVDLVVWLTVLLCVLRAALRAQPRWWLAAGLAVGVGLWFKLLIGLLVAALVLAVLAVGPRSLLRSRWCWAGAALALAVGAPNLVYQVANDFPQLTMAEALRQHKGAEARTLLLPFQLVTVGLPLLPVVVAGLVAAWRRPALRPIRALVPGYALMLVALLVLAAQPYYTAGLVLALHAVGSLPAEQWIDRVARRRRLVTAAVALNAVAATAFALPVFPLSVQERLGLAAADQVTRDQIGWPRYVRQVADVWAALSSADRAHAVLITGNYGEYGAIDRYGARYGLPVDRLYSGQNELHRLAVPPGDTTVVVLFGLGEDGGVVATWFGSCRIAARLDHGLDIDNEEQGRPVAVCRRPMASLPVLWPRFLHYD